MLDILFGTTNASKIADFIASDYFRGFRVHLLRDFSLPDIEETGTTCEENALLKARTLFEVTHLPTLADDTGFFIHALDGYPGVFAARVAGPEKDFVRVKEDIRQRLAPYEDRTAHFSTALAFVDSSQEKVVRADVFGHFVYGEEPTTVDKGGYRDAFRPNGAPCTIIDMTSDQKALYLPRQKALKDLWHALGFC